jgi:hypothetical protein
MIKIIRYTSSFPSKKWFKVIIVLGLCSITLDYLKGQSKSEIFCFNYLFAKNNLKISNPKKLSGFNVGYNNQPSFQDEENILLTSDFKDGTFTNIFNLNLANNSLEQITKTDSISEYSPTLSEDKKYIYTVRSEKDGKTQSLWQYPADKSNIGKRIFGQLDNIGYYKFIGKDQCAMFLVTDPVSLVVGNTVDNSISRPLMTNIGRCLKKGKNQSLFFTQKENEKWMLKTFDGTDIKTLFEIGSQDFELDQFDNVVSSEGTILTYYTNKGKKKPIADLSIYGLSNITRIAFGLNKIIIVTDVK